MHKRITVGLRQDVYARLKNKGRFGESFSELVSRLIDELDNVFPATGTTNSGGNS
jgi:predicted CopG family antitoxin